MELHLLLTPEIKAAKPTSVEITCSGGETDIYFDDREIITGDNVFIKGDKDVIVNWLKAFDEIPVGSGSIGWDIFKMRKIKPNA